MTEHDRKQQILQAEEAILRLAEQLGALARQSRTAADEAAGNCQTATAALGHARDLLQQTMVTLQESMRQSSSALAEARDQVGQARTDLHALTQQVGQITPTLQRHLETALGEVANAAHLVSQGQERLRQDVLSLRRLTWVILIAGLLAFGTSLLVLFLGTCAVKIV